MKKLLFILFILPIFCFGQTNISPQFKRKIPADSLIGYSIPGVTGTHWLPDTAWIRKHGGGTLYLSSTYFQGTGSTSSDPVIIKPIFINNSSTLQTANFNISGRGKADTLYANKNMLLGTSANKAWNAGYRTFNMAGDVGLRSLIGGHDLLLYNNVYNVNADNNWTYANNGFASWFYLDEGGGMDFYSLPSGTAGSTVSMSKPIFSVTRNGATLTTLTDTTAAAKVIAVDASGKLYKAPAGSALGTGTNGEILMWTSGAPTWTNAGLLNLVSNEVPSGAVNGTNTTFTLANTPILGSVSLYKNGMLQYAGVGNDYTISGDTITTAVAPLSGTILLATYTISAGSPLTYSYTFSTGLNNTSGTITLANTAVTPGTYTNPTITIDAQGRATFASSGSGGGTTTNPLTNGPGLLTFSYNGGTPGIQAAADTNYVGLAQDMILSGMGVTLSGTTATVGAGSYRLNQTNHSTSSTGVTIPAQNATLNRYTLIVGNTSGALSAINGTLAADAVEPALPSNDILITRIYIPSVASGGSTTTGGTGGKGTTTNALNGGYGILPFSYNGGTSGVKVSTDTTRVQTIDNFFPKGDTRYQKTLISGTNIKTINGNSLLGSGDLTISSGMTNPMTTTGDIIYSSSGSTPARLGIGSTNQVLTVIGGVPTWQTPASGGVSSFSAGTTGLTPNTATTGAITLAGTLAVSNGGTGVTSVTTSPTATSFAGWDANKNLLANNHLNGGQSVASTGGSISLTVGSPYRTIITGTTTETVVLPVASTLSQWQDFAITNSSTGIVTVQSSGGNTVLSMGAGTAATFTCVTTSGTTAASWSTSGAAAYLPLAGGAMTGQISSSFSTTISSDNGLSGSSQRRAFFGYNPAGTGVPEVYFNAGSSSVQYRYDQILWSDGTNSMSFFPPSLTASRTVTLPDATGTVALTNQIVVWHELTGGTQTMAVGNGYIATTPTSLYSYTLPTTATVGQRIAVVGYSSGGWTIAQNAGQNIIFGGTSTTAGTSGHLDSANRYDSVDLICTVANTTFVVRTHEGTPTVH